MKRTLRIISAAALLFAGTAAAHAFTVVNHATVAYIAEKHMTPKALANFRKAFDNHPLAEFASYPDFFREIYIVKGEPLGHLVNLDENMYPVATPNGKYLNAYEGMLRAIGELKDYKNLDDSTKYTAMGMLVHFMGDSHCPSHLRYADKRDLRAKTIYYKTYSYDKKKPAEKVNYHEFWDSWCSDKRYSRSYLDRALLFDTCSERQIKEIQKGSLEDWIHACALACKDIYDVEEGQTVYRVYVTRKAELVATQVRDAGYRLAAIMNRLFAK